MSYRALLLVVWVLPVACDASVNLDHADGLVRALAEVDAGQRPMIFLVGLGELGLPRGGDCAEGLMKSGQMDPAMRSMLLAEAFAACKLACPSSAAFRAMAEAPPGEKTAVAVKDCDARGPDAVFGGPLAALRPKMAWHDYIFGRAGIEALRAALKKDGSARAQEIGRKLEALVPRLAEDMAKAGPQAP